MNALSRPISTIDGAPLHLDLLTHLDFCRRVRELNELAAAEGLTLPMPATWIATLETLGYTVDLATGKWASTRSHPPQAYRSSNPGGLIRLASPQPHPCLNLENFADRFDR